MGSSLGVPVFGADCIPLYNATANITELVIVDVASNTTVPCGCRVEEGGENMVLLGIMMGLVSSVAINIGQNLQSLGGKEPGAAEKPCSSRTWVTGLTIFATGSIGNMVAMAFASATILVPLESSQFVTNLIFSRLVNDVAITGRQVFGTSLAIFGTVLICMFGPNDQRCFTYHEFQSFWLNPTWLVWVAVTFASSAIGWLYYARLRTAVRGPNPPRWAEAGLPSLFAVSSALIGGAQ